jgi:glycosyltransferase involved in cell wall biosynthesis
MTTAGKVQPAVAAKEQLPRMLAINQVTSPLFGDLVDSFVDHCQTVRLLAGELKAGPGRDRFEWLRATGLVRSPAWKRIWTWSVFTCQALWAMAKHHDHFVFMTTNPPLVPWVAPLAKRLFGMRYALLVYDVYPDVLSRMGMIRRNGLIERLLRRLSARSMQGAECVIALGEHMKRTILAHLPPGQAVPVEVIPNWADTDTIQPIPRAANPFAREHGLMDKFVVMYSGNFGATHDVESIVDAAELLTGLPDVQFVLIGGGTRLKEIQRYVRTKALPNLLLLDWLPAEQLRYSLTSADCLVVSLDAGYEGISVPGKTYTSLAAGAAVLAVTPPRTELADLVREEQCGLWVPPRSSVDLAKAVRGLHADPSRVDRMKANARAAAETRYNVEACTRRYREILLPLMARLSGADLSRSAPDRTT